MAARLVVGDVGDHAGDAAAGADDATGHGHLPSCPATTSAVCRNASRVSASGRPQAACNARVPRRRNDDPGYAPLTLVVADPETEWTGEADDNVRKRLAE